MNRERLVDDLASGASVRRDDGSQDPKVLAGVRVRAGTDLDLPTAAAALSSGALHLVVDRRSAQIRCQLWCQLGRCRQPA